MLSEIEICNLKIPMFNVCIISGIVIALLLFLNANRYVSESEKDNLLVVLGITIPGAFVCAWMFNKMIFIDRSSSFQEFLSSYKGMTFLGGLIGGITIFAVVHRCMFHDAEILKMHMNILSPYICIAHALGRFGCFCAGCCFGKPTDCLIGVAFQYGTPAYEQYGSLRLVPIQLIEMTILVIIGIVLMRIPMHNRATGYLIMYAGSRFLIEFFRGDIRGSKIGGMYPSQIMSGGILVILFILRWRRKRIKEEYDK